MNELTPRLSLAVLEYLKKRPAVITNVAMRKESANERLHALLSRNRVLYSTMVHSETITSAESASFRGESMASGAKAMICISNKPTRLLVMCVLSAEKTISFSKLKKHLQIKDLCLASVDDVFDLTGCLVGAVPPFGSSLFQVRTLMDPSLLRQGDTMSFNAGLRTESIKMLVQDFLAIETPEVVAFAKEEEG